MLHLHPGRNDRLQLTVFKEVCDVQLQRGEDLVEHFEVLAKAGHLDDKAGGSLRGRKRGQRNELQRQQRQQRAGAHRSTNLTTMGRKRNTRLSKLFPKA